MARKSAGTRRIRWDRMGRVALLAVLGVILLAYLSPAKRWIQQSGTAKAQKAELAEQERQHSRLERRVRALRNPAALEREARRLGMVKTGERSFVIENPSR